MVSMLPGISGAILAVCFKVYERAIHDIAHVREVFRAEFWFLAAIGAGILAGMFAGALALDFFLENYRMMTIFAAAGLILGQLPMLHRESGGLRGASAGNAAALSLGLLLAAFLLALNVAGIVDTSGGSSDRDLMSDGAASYGYMIAIGLIMAVSKLVPGISGATVLLAMGLMDPLTKGVAGFDMPLLAAFGLGLVGGILLFSKAVDFALARCRRSTYMLILGLTVGSLFLIAYDGVGLAGGASDLAVGAIAAAAGAAVSLWMAWIGDRAKTA